MKKIASKLMDFGMDFQYENNGSEGEMIVSYDISIKVTNQNGKVYFEHEGEIDITEAKNFEETNKVMNYLASRIEDICIEETT